MNTFLKDYGQSEIKMHKISKKFSFLGYTSCVCVYIYTSIIYISGIYYELRTVQKKSIVIMSIVIYTSLPRGFNIEISETSCFLFATLSCSYLYISMYLREANILC